MTNYKIEGSKDDYSILDTRHDKIIKAGLNQKQLAEEMDTMYFLQFNSFTNPTFTANPSLEELQPFLTLGKRIEKIHRDGLREKIVRPREGYYG